MQYIFDKTDTIGFPYSAELLEWLHDNYPYSKYRIVEVQPVDA